MPRTPTRRRAAQLATLFPIALALVLAAAPSLILTGAPAAAATPVPARAFSCFRNSMKEPLVLRIEWPKPERYAIFAWPAGTTLKVHVGGGADEVRWCWGKSLKDISGGCPDARRQWVVRNNCGG